MSISGLYSALVLRGGMGSLPTSKYSCSAEESLVILSPLRQAQPSSDPYLSILALVEPRDSSDVCRGDYLAKIAD